MAAQVRYRLATTEDLPAIVQMLADDTLGAARERAETPLPQGYYDAFKAIDSDPNIELIVAEAAGRIVGTVQVGYVPGLSRQGM
jgi:hypothetical protein